MPLALAAAGPLPSLVTLHIDRNLIGDEGMYAIAATIASCAWPKMCLERGKKKSKRRLEVSGQYDPEMELHTCTPQAIQAVVDAVRQIELDARALLPLA